MEVLEEWLAKRKSEKQIQEQEKTMQFEIKLQETKLELQEEFHQKVETKG